MGVYAYLGEVDMDPIIHILTAEWGCMLTYGRRAICLEDLNVKDVYGSQYIGYDVG